MPRDLFFASAHNAYLLLLLIPLALLLYYGWRKRKEALFSIINFHDSLLKGSSQQILRSILLLLGVLFTLLALMRPEGDLRSSSTNKASAALELYVLIDSSLSMGVKDALNGISRFERAKEITAKLIEELKGNQISLNLFSDRIQTVVPLTYDALFLQLALRGVSLNEGGFSGTDFEPVLKELKRHIAKKTYSGNSVLLILSDGGDTKIEDLTGAEKKRAIEAIVGSAPDMPINVVLLGSPKGGPIPGVSLKGKAVESKADPDLLKALALKHFYNDSEAIVDQLLEAFKGEKTQYLEKASKEWSATSYFQIPLGLALLCFLLVNPWSRLRMLSLIFLSMSLNADELWLQDRKLYNESIKSIEQKAYGEALLYLEGISPLAYGSPIFRSRIAINYGQASLGRAAELKDPYLLEQGLYILRLFGLQPCEPLTLCYPELMSLVEGRLQIALSDGRDRKSRYLDPYPYMHFAALMPSKEVIQRVEFLVPEIKGATTSSEIFKKSFANLQKFKSEDGEEAIRTLLRETEIVSFIVLLGGGEVELKALQSNFPKILQQLELFQQKAFDQGFCQCTPWGEVIPLLTAGGSYLNAITTEMATGNLFNYINEAVKKFRAALLKFTSVKSSEQKEQKASNELSEMQQLDEKPVKPILESSGEGKPW